MVAIFLDLFKILAKFNFIIFKIDIINMIDFQTI